MHDFRLFYYFQWFGSVIALTRDDIDTLSAITFKMEVIHLIKSKTLKGKTDHLLFVMLYIKKESVQKHIKSAT
jgi:hypothetical protein